VVFIPIFGIHSIELDLILFFTKYFFILLGTFFLIRIHILIRDYFDKDFKHASTLQAYILILIVIFTVLNLFTYYQTVSNPNGYYVLQLNLILFITCISLFFPVGIYLLYRNRIILQEIKNDKIRKGVKFIIFIGGFLVFERGYNITLYGPSYYYLGIPLNGSIIINSFILIFLFISFIIGIMRSPKIMDRISSFFSVKAVYIIKKTGQLLFEQNFQKEEKTSDSLIIGGFIFAVTTGIKKMLKLKKDINSFTSKKRSVLIQHGNHVFGVLIVRENSVHLNKKLNELIDRYEKNYANELANWTGQVEKREEVHNWVDELFRKK